MLKFCKKQNNVKIFKFYLLLQMFLENQSKKNKTPIDIFISTVLRVMFSDNW